MVDVTLMPSFANYISTSLFSPNFPWVETNFASRWRVKWCINNEFTNDFLRFHKLGLSKYYHGPAGSSMGESWRNQSHGASSKHFGFLWSGSRTSSFPLSFKRFDFICNNGLFSTASSWLLDVPRFSSWCPISRWRLQEPRMSLYKENRAHSCYFTQVHSTLKGNRGLGRMRWEYSRYLTPLRTPLDWGVSRLPFNAHDLPTS